jgi:hypothetical protein
MKQAAAVIAELPERRINVIDVGCWTGAVKYSRSALTLYTMLRSTSSLISSRSRLATVILGKGRCTNIQIPCATRC